MGRLRGGRSEVDRPHGNPDAGARQTGSRVPGIGTLGGEGDMNKDDRIVELLLAWEDATARGDPPTPEDLCRDCPELLPEFRRVLGGVGAVNALLKGAGAPDPA